VELVLVFIGVYAAFWLNNYQQHQQEAKRRDQFWHRSSEHCARELRAEKLTPPKKNNTRGISACAGGRRDAAAASVRFHDRLQSGRFRHAASIRGIELLDVETLTALRNDESVIRWGLSRMAHYQKLSDELIMPNLDQEISFFYDPTTRKLRKTFRNVSRSAASNGEIRTRPGSNAHRTAQTHSGRTAPVRRGGRIFRGSVNCPFKCRPARTSAT